jgi:hypothetical protein
VEALFLDDDWRAVTAVNLSPDAVQRVRRSGLVEAQRLAELVAAQLPALILSACASPAEPRRQARGKPRRTRAEVLASIAQANAMRDAARQPGRAIGLGPS